MIRKKIDLCQKLTMINLVINILLSRDDHGLL